MSATLVVHETAHLEVDWTGNVWLKAVAEADGPDPWWRVAAFWVVRLAFGGRAARAIAASAEEPRRAVLLGNADDAIRWPVGFGRIPDWLWDEVEQCRAMVTEEPHAEYRRQVQADYDRGLGDPGRWG